MKSKGTFTAAIATGALAVALSACGGSDPTTEAATTSAQGANAGSSEKRGSQAKGGGSQRKAASEAKGGGGEAASSTSTVKVKVAPLRVSGGGSKPFRSKGGDNSIQTYGEESGETELTEAAEALHRYFVAFASSDWKTACSYLAKSVVQGFKQLASSGGGSTNKDCASIFAALSGGIDRSAQLRHEMTEVDAYSLRREGDQAFLIYRGMEYDTGSSYGPSDLYAMLMKQEDGTWKVGLVSGNEMGIPRKLLKQK
jgi:hypothetical protein